MNAFPDTGPTYRPSLKKRISSVISPLLLGITIFPFRTSIARFVPAEASCNVCAV